MALSKTILALCLLFCLVAVCSAWLEESASSTPSRSHSRSRTPSRSVTAAASHSKSRSKTPAASSCPPSKSKAAAASSCPPSHTPAASKTRAASKTAAASTTPVASPTSSPVVEVVVEPLFPEKPVGVIIGDIVCKDVKNHPLGAFWDTDFESHRFQTNRTRCASNEWTFNFLAFSGNEKDHCCPQSCVPVDVYYKVAGQDWTLADVLSPDDFRKSKLATIHINLTCPPSRIRFLFKSQTRDEGVWAFWHFTATTNHCVQLPGAGW